MTNKMNEEISNDFFWDKEPLKEVNTIQEVLKPLGYKIIGFNEKNNTSILLYLEKKQSFVRID